MFRDVRDGGALTLKADVTWFCRKPDVVEEVKSPPQLSDDPRQASPLGEGPLPACCGVPQAICYLSKGLLPVAASRPGVSLPRFCIAMPSFPYPLPLSPLPAPGAAAV